MYASPIPYDAERIHAAAVSCSDGRYGDQLDDFLHNVLGLPRYDRVAIPGGAAPLAGHVAVWRDAEVLSQELRFLIRSHDLDRVVLIAHESCGYYAKRLSVEPERIDAAQREDLVKAARHVAGFGGGVGVETYFASLRGGVVVFEAVR